MDSPFLAAMAAGLAERGLRVARFEFSYMRARRQGGGRKAPDREPELRRAWLAAIAAAGASGASGASDPEGGGRRLWIGGKSLGGRIPTIIPAQPPPPPLALPPPPFPPPPP